MNRFFVFCGAVLSTLIGLFFPLWPFSYPAGNEYPGGTKTLTLFAGLNGYYIPGQDETRYSLMPIESIIIFILLAVCGATTGYFIYKYSRCNAQPGAAADAGTGRSGG